MYECETWLGLGKNPRRDLLPRERLCRCRCCCSVDRFCVRAAGFRTWLSALAVALHCVRRAALLPRLIAVSKFRKRSARRCSIPWVCSVARNSMAGVDSFFTRPAVRVERTQLRRFPCCSTCEGNVRRLLLGFLLINCLGMAFAEDNAESDHTNRLQVLAFHFRINTGHQRKFDFPQPGVSVLTVADQKVRSKLQNGCSRLRKDSGGLAD